MPDLPFRSCAGGCGRPVKHGRCSACLKRYLGVDGARGSRHSLYDARWRRESKQFLRENPFCADPDNLHGQTLMLATDTDHIVPHKGNIRLFRDKTNWQPLCKACHSRKTASEGGFGNDQH